MRCHIHGKACHSAYAPDGVNAIEYAAKLITRLGVLGEKLAPQADARFDPPYSTVQVGLITGGAALNIVPERCQFDFEIRHLPDVSLDETLTGCRRKPTMNWCRRCARWRRRQRSAFSRSASIPVC